MATIWVKPKSPRKQRLIFVNRYYYPDSSATAQLLEDLTKAASVTDRQVSVVTGRYRYDQTDLRLAPRQTLNGIDIHRIWTPGFNRRNTCARAIEYLCFYAMATITVWRLTRAGDVIVATTDPPMLSVALQPVVSLRNAQLINWLQDHYPEIAQRLGWGKHSPGRFAFRILARARNHSLRVAAANVVPSQLMRDHLLKNHVPHESLHVIHNWSDDEGIRPVSQQQNKMRRHWKFGPEHFIVAYSGNLGRAHEIKTLLVAIRYFERATDPTARNIRFLFVGGGFHYDCLRSETNCHSRLVTFQPYQPRAALTLSLGVADVHLTILRRELEGLVMPSKFYGIAAAGRAIIHIGDPNGEIAQVLADGSCGFAVAEGDGNGLVQAIRKLAKNRERTTAMGLRARQLLEENYTRRSALAAWQRIIDDVSN